MNEPTIAILVPFMDSNYDPAACFTSLLKQDYPHLTIYLVGTSATIPVTWNRDNRFQHLESSSLLPQKLGFLIQQLDEDFILLVDPHDQLDQSTSLSELINLAQQQNCDLIMPNFVKLQPDGTYIFPNLWRKPEELITHNNYHFLIKSIQAMRVLPGSLIKRSL